METIQTLLSHRTIREYKNQEVPQTVLDDILAAAVRGSTTGNMQLYSIIVTRDEAMKKQLAPLHFNQKLVTEAPLLLTFCADFNRFNKWCEYRGVEPVYDNFLSFNWALIDAVIAAQNACVAAEAHGLGICYLGTTNYTADKIIDLLNLPKGVVPITAISVGYPKTMPELTDRLPIEAVVHQETYKDYDKESIDSLFAEKEALPSSKQLLEENQLESLPQIFVEKRYTKKDNVHFSKVFFEVMKKQGFFNHEG